MTIDVGTEDVRKFRVTEQIGHILRRASQRHGSIFSEIMLSGITPTRFAAMCMLHERGSLSQNELGRLTAMDIATIKGVVDRLADRGLVLVGADPNDARRNVIELSPLGRELLANAIPKGLEITEQTLKPLTPPERLKLLGLLRKITD